jgi:hypothetical protein
MGLTVDQAAAIFLYTYEAPVRTQSVYAKLNAALREEDRNLVKPYFAYLRLLLDALVKLPKYDKTLYRGVKVDLKDNYPEGTEFTWWGFSSTTRDAKVLEGNAFLGTTVHAHYFELMLVLMVE